ncbi:MAG: alpha/beta fold hydrolase [Emcibacteraceae bacterium]|nr:alpha/beta fold hydrolase [Emcibacteraceae bacterium]
MTFKEKPPWWGGDLQTIRNHLRTAIKSLPGNSVAITIPTNDGSADQLTATLDTPHTPARGPLIILIHGLTGSENSRYMMASSAFHLGHGRRVLRLNLRGAGSSAQSCSRHYHGGHISDISDTLDYLDDNQKSNGVFLIGFSLGGNILLNFLAANNRHNLLGASSVCASIDPKAAAKRLLDFRNAFYQARLLRQMKQENLEGNSKLSIEQKRTISSTRSIYEFDDKVTAPKNGYKDAEDYYFQTNSARKVQNINIPLLMISAKNDPWIPSKSYEMIKQNCPKNIKILLTDSGGHVGFHEKGQQETWYDRQINNFITEQT